MKHLIILNGRSTAGKDTFVKLVTEALYDLSGNNWEFANISSVQPIKDIINQIGLDDADKGLEWRQLVVDMKVALNKVRRYADELAVRMVREELNKASENAVVFLHVREPESICQIMTRVPFNWKVTTIWIERFNVPSQANDSTSKDFLYNYIITNDGSLEEFKTQAIEFAKKFLEN